MFCKAEVQWWWPPPRAAFVMGMGEPAGAARPPAVPHFWIPAAVAARKRNIGNVGGAGNTGNVGTLGTRCPWGTEPQHGAPHPPQQSVGPWRYLEVLQHGALLRKQQRAVRALENADALIEQMLVEVGGEQRLVGEHRVAHGALIDHPVGSEKSSEGQEERRGPTA